MKFPMKNLLVFAVVLFAMGLCFGCAVQEDEADLRATKATEAAMSEAFRQVGMPNIVNFQQKKLMKMIYELCDKEDLICYAYLYDAFHGKVGQFLGKCVGYGIPFSAQYTNPQKIAGRYSQGGFAVLPQPDPNGLFMPTSSSATWLIMLDPETKKPRPVYVEPQIIVSAFPLR